MWAIWRLFQLKHLVQSLSCLKEYAQIYTSWGLDLTLYMKWYVVNRWHMQDDMVKLFWKLEYIFCVLYTAEPTHTVSHQNSCLALLVLFWKLYICVFGKKYVLILLAFFFFFIYCHNMLKLATDYFNFWRRHWLFTMLVMCAATANVLGNVDP